MTAPKQVTINGKPAIRGTCPVCGTAVSRYPNLTIEEIVNIKNELYMPPNERVDRLQRVQSEIVRIFKNWKLEEGRKYIRFICPREKVKPFSSVIDKINEMRSRFIDARGLDDLYDLIGTKILCPYLTDVDVVIKWLFDPDQCFLVEPSLEKAKKKKKKMEEERGYRGYHFYLRLKKDYVSRQKLPKGSENEKFEVQIKTLLEEAWDAKTHDVTFKPRQPVKPILEEHMKLVSRALVVLDEQTELLKDEIQEEEREERRRRETTKLVFLTALVPEEKREKFGFPKDKPVEQLNEKDIGKIKGKIEGEISKSGINGLICNTYTLLAFATGSRDVEETAFTCANKLVEQSKQNTDLLAEALSIKAFMQWALDYIPEALEDISKAINYRNKISYKGDYVYYVCESIDPTQEQKRRAKEYVDEIEKQIKAEPSEVLPYTKDSLGYFYIKFGEDQETIERGKKYICESYEQIKSDPENTLFIPVSRAFYEMHNVLALKRLLELKRKLSTSY